MTERIKVNRYYIFPHSGDPDELPPMPDDLPEMPYIEFVQSKNIYDILHQISISTLRKKKQKELNVFFRSALEAILLHMDESGEHDCKYQNQK